MNHYLIETGIQGHELAKQTRNEMDELIRKKNRIIARTENRIIGSACRDFREIHGLRLVDVQKNFQNIYNFETGRSRNVKHLERYIELAHSLDDADTLFDLLLKGVIDGG